MLSTCKHRSLFLLIACAVCVLPARATDLDFGMDKTADQLRDEAELIVTGRIRGVYVRHDQSEGGITGLYVADIEIKSVEKGELEKRVSVLGRYWARLRTDRRMPGCSPTSYAPLPQEGDLVRAHLRQTPHGWRVVPPNGFTILEENPDPEPAILLTEAESQGDARAVDSAPAAGPRNGSASWIRHWWIPAATLVLGALIGVPLGRVIRPRPEYRKN